MTGDFWLWVLMVVALLCFGASVVGFLRRR